MILGKINSVIFLLVFEKVSAQYSLLIMIEKWKRALDENMKVVAIFMDLSKAKLKAYGLQLIALKQLLQIVFKGQKSIIVVVHGLQ